MTWLSNAYDVCRSSRNTQYQAANNEEGRTGPLIDWLRASIDWIVKLKSVQVKFKSQMWISKETSRPETSCLIKPQTKTGKIRKAADWPARTILDKVTTQKKGSHWGLSEMFENVHLKLLLEMFENIQYYLLPEMMLFNNLLEIRCLTLRRAFFWQTSGAAYS